MALSAAKRVWVIVALIISATVHLSAQSYTNSPGDSLIQYLSLEQPTVMNIIQQHPTSDTLIFKWRKIQADIPAAWTASLCDNGACFSTLRDSGMMIPIVPGDDGLMSLHCTPHTTSGTAIIRYALYTTQTPMHIDTLTWIIYASTTSIESTTIAAPKIYSYGGHIFLKSISGVYDNMKIYSIDGREIYGSPVVSDVFLSEKKLSEVIVVLTGNGTTFSKKVSVY
jgi:hypothetical protein